MKHYLFSYGTLQKEEVQIELFGRKLQGSTDVLKGWKASPIEIRDENFLSKGEDKMQLTVVHSKDENDMIKGMALEVNEQDLQLADAYEPDGYKRIVVNLESGKEAWLYIASSS